MVAILSTKHVVHLDYFALGGLLVGKIFTFNFRFLQLLQAVRTFLLLGMRSSGDTLAGPSVAGLNGRSGSVKTITRPPSSTLEESNRYDSIPLS